MPPSRCQLAMACSMVNLEHPAASVPRLHFAMLTYGALAATKRCVRSLREHTGQPFELWIVDNASTDGTQQWLAAQHEPWLHWQGNTENRGVPGGRNDLLDLILPHAAPHDWIVFVDNDLEFRANWLEPFVQAIARHPEARVFGKVGCFVVVHDDTRTLLPAPAVTGPVDVVSGGFACFVRVDAARVIGPFDERLGRFWHEDDDYCVRALQHGLGVVAVPEAAIEHHEHGSGVAVPDLVNGGSLTNLRYLVGKWRAAGLVDRDGWLMRANGPYVPPLVRDELRRRGRLHDGRERGPIGRTEIAAAIELLAGVIDAPEPEAWLVRNRRPIPRCLHALLALHLEQARQLGDDTLAAQFGRIEAALARQATSRILAGALRLPNGPENAPAGSGVCRVADFDEARFVAAARELGLSVLVADPHARAEGHWQSIALAMHLGEASPRTVRWIGSRDEVTARWLAKRGARIVDDRSAAATAPGRCDAVVFWQTTDPDVLQEALAAHADERTLVVCTGSVVLNGVPDRATPQPHQLVLDVLERARLRPLHDLNLRPDELVLEACATSVAAEKHYPQLSRLLRGQLLTSFAIAARRLPVTSPSAAVLVPAAPLSPATIRVGVDLRTIFQADSASRGIGKFTTQHLAAVCDADPGLRLVGYSLRAEDRLPASLRRPEISLQPIDTYRPGDVDLVHLPDPMNMCYGFDSPLRVMRHERTTVTFHDLTPLHLYIEQWPRTNRDAYLDRLRQIERGNCHLLTNSVFTRDDALRHLAVPAERTTPILAGLHHDGGAPPSAEAIAAVHAELGVKEPFVLHVGALDPHKNFLSSLNAFLMARAQQPLQLVVVGAVDHGMAGVADYCARRQIPDVVFTGYLPRRHLDALYASATALLVLSRAEGFGLPILEAMAKGCPVIASNATSHPEVAGDAAVLVDPDDQAGAAGWLRRLLQDAALRDDLRRRGQRRAQSFSWRSVAERTLVVWERMAAGAERSPVLTG
jgi:glycosyltransferase involved in cell wall biosynthesis/GT2 family glycosyltransferase